MQRASGSKRFAAWILCLTTCLTACPPPMAAEPAVSPEELRILHGVPGDPPQKPVCPFRRSSRVHCRDPISYVYSNENRRFLFAPYIKNLGGGYAGIGADANYSFIARARSRWVWLFDHDITIVRLHQILKAFIKASPSPRDLTARFRKDQYESSLRVLADEYPDSLRRRPLIRVFKRYRAKLYSYYRAAIAPRKKFADFGWLRNPADYGYIRLLYRQNRIAILSGDLLKDRAMAGIGASARALKTVIRVYYPSNAEEFWYFEKNYRANIQALPFDERSVALRTLSPVRVHRRAINRWHPRRKDRYWHYVVHRALDFQQKVGRKEYRTVDAWKLERKRTKYEDLSTIGL